MDKTSRRAQILGCAKEIFGVKGYHSTSVGDIIELAQIARGTFYLYFDSKRAIFDELLDQTFEALDKDIRRIDSQHPTLSVMEQMRGNVERVIATFADDVHLTRILLCEAVGLDQGFDRKLREFYARIRAMVEMSLELGMAMGLIRPLSRPIVASLIVGSIKELMYDLVSNGHLPFPRDALVEEILGYTLRGVIEESPQINQLSKNGSANKEEGC